MRPLNSLRPVAIDLFAGAGGLSLGLAQAGFEVRAAVDNDPVAAATYRANIGDHISCEAIESLTADVLLERAGIARGECTLLTGGPPCQGFSLQRRGPREDVRNRLVLQFIRMAEEIRPKFFLMENVGALLSKNGTSFLNEFAERSAEMGYVLHIELLNASDFGVPQHRRRALLVGERIEGGHARFRFPEPHTNGCPKTVRDALLGLPSPPPDGSPHPLVPNHYRERRLSALNVERIRHVPQGGGRADLPIHLQLPCHRNNATHRHLDVYGRLAWNAPSGTITARFDSFTRGRFAHPEEHRSLTIREGARLQTFPDSFVFEGNREEQARQVGNAVPPLLARQLGEAFLDALAQEAKAAA